MKKKGWWIFGIILVLFFCGGTSKGWKVPSKTVFSEKEEKRIYQVFVGEHNFTTKNIIVPLSVYNIDLLDIAVKFQLQVEDEGTKKKLEQVVYRNFSNYQEQIEKIFIDSGFHQDLEKFQVYGALLEKITVRTTIIQLERFQKAYPKVWWEEG